MEDMRNGRKGEYLDLPFFCGCGGWAAFLYDRTVPKIGAAFPDSPVRLWIAAYAKLAPDGAQTSNAAIAGTGRLLEASPYFRHWFCI